MGLRESGIEGEVEGKNWRVAERGKEPEGGRREGEVCGEKRMERKGVEEVRDVEEWRRWRSEEMWRRWRSEVDDEEKAK